MGKRTVYRTDASELNLGQILMPRGDHLATLHPNKNPMISDALGRV
jgi:hypothetical protein